MRPAAEALIVIDVQNDFCPGGALAVAGGDEIVPGINALMAEFQTIVLTQDWHPANHLSFADNHPGAAPFSLTDMPYGKQVLWPAHCVQGSDGAAFHPALDTQHADFTLRKGHRSELDSYSAFFENDRRTQTGLDAYLRSRAVEAVAVIGLALDYCVAWSAEDASRLGYRTRVILPGCRAIDQGGSLERALRALRQAGVALEDTACAEQNR